MTDFRPSGFSVYARTVTVPIPTAPKEETHRRVSPLGIPLCRQGGWTTPLEPPIITAISSGTSPSACYRRGFRSSACIPWFIPHSLMVPLHAKGINQYATPNINRADREFESVPPTFPVGLSMKRLRQKASLRGGRCQLRQQMTEGVPYISRSAP